MRLEYLLFVLLGSCSAALERFLQIPNGRTTEILGDATVEIIDQFFAHRATFINIFAAGNNQGNEDDAKDAISYVLNKMDGSLPYHLHVISRTKPKLFRINNMGSSSVFFVDGYNSFSRICDNILRPLLLNEEYFLIVFTGGRTWSEIENEAGRIFNASWSGKLVNVYLLASADIDEDVVAKLYTFFPYNEKSCGKANPVIVNEYRKEGFASELNVFANKYKNLHQCPMNVMIFLVSGLMSFDENRNLQGLESNILKYISKAMNFRINIKSASNRAGSDIPNAIAMLSNGSADIAVGELKVTGGSRSHYSVTYPHLYESVGFIKPIGIPYTPLQKLSMPFFTEVWVWFLVAFVVVSIGYYLIFGQSFFDQINIVMGGGLGQMPRAIRARSLIAMWMFATLILRNAYQGALFDILQEQIRHQPIETVEDLARYNYSIYCRGNTCKWLHLLHPHMQQQTKFIPPGEVASLWHSLSDESLRGVYVESEITLAYFNKYSAKKEPLVMMNEKLFASSMVMFVRKDQTLVAELNFHVQNLASIGLLKYWKDELLQGRKIRKQKVPEKLTLSQLEGILYICAALYAISILVFVLELILWKIQR